VKPTAITRFAEVEGLRIIAEYEAETGKDVDALAARSSLPPWLPPAPRNAAWSLPSSTGFPATLRSFHA
jgi:hypothetical protein